MAPMSVRRWPVLLPVAAVLVVVVLLWTVSVLATAEMVYI